MPVVSSSHEDDRLVVERVRQGDREAYAVLVDRYGDRLHAMLAHLVDGDQELAAELVQEAFVRAFERLDQFAGHSSFYTWIYRLARNRSLDLLARCRPQACDPEVLGHIAPPQPGRPEQALCQQETVALVQAGLAQLPAEMREILLLRDFDGHDYATIAAMLDVPEGTIKSRLFRARSALREVLAPVLEGEAP